MTAASDRFVSDLPYDAGRIHAAAIYCSDGRLGEHIDEFLQRGLGLPRYDRVTCPGGPVALAGRLSAFYELQGVEEQLRFLAQVHEIERVVLIAHDNCAYYSVRLGMPSDRIVAEQLDDLRKARSAVQRIIPGIHVAQYLARVRGSQVAFESV